MVMGTGKTHQIIKEINTFFQNIKGGEMRRYIVVVPLRTEIDRFKYECRSAVFETPEEDTGHMRDDLLYLIRNNRNVVVTHALWGMLDQKVLDTIRDHNYHLVIDEVLNCLEVLNFKAITIKEMLNMKDPYIRIGENGRVYWIGPQDYDGTEVFTKIKKKCEAGTIYTYTNARGETGMLVWQIPVELFTVSDNITICTYMFEHSEMRAFFDLNDIDYEIAAFPGREAVSKKVFRDNITILEPTAKWKKESNGSIFSETWWTKRIGGADKIKKYSRAFKEYLRNAYSINTPMLGDRLLWTCPKSVSTYDMNGYKIPGKKQCFSLCKGKTWLNKKARATNDYADRDIIIYMVNLYNDPQLDKYLESKSHIIEEDKQALSNMLQFIWRSAIRNGKPITVFIGSNRMRKLLKDWLDE